MALLYPINIDNSSEEIEFQSYCWALKNDITKTISEWEAIEIFKSEIPAMCLEKIAAGEEVEYFKGLLEKVRKSNRSTLPPLDFKKAAMYPIHKLAEELTSKIVRFNVICCPAHTDKTPSLYLRKKTNKWRCYSCQRHGDPIDLMMLFLGISNIEAVKRLS